MSQGSYILGRRLGYPLDVVDVLPLIRDRDQEIRKGDVLTR